MLKFKCPYCNFEVDETELAPGGQAHINRPKFDVSDKDFSNYLFYRKNPKGVHFEKWLHQYGCGKWFIAARCTVSMEVFGTYKAQTSKPPGSVVKNILARRPNWSGFTNE